MVKISKENFMKIYNETGGCVRAIATKLRVSDYYVRKACRDLKLPEGKEKRGAKKKSILIED